ncbi:hypothetical protein BASA50_004429 [Batrachochytrium salamandrivorans]|uniref:Uncharacterized protein n=1 Tax=Batrachochytrium salamandrivorans TaxID=1357716 RepID=A0ABQ8FFQ8_9FUNG|nr:hypothetical protein BASA61_005621 [Batrachochytrium salamandrivorans]KAH6597513.1 hypothetical protein BASA50_004429 [Batrachochytrium salamandrivorans]
MSDQRVRSTVEDSQNDRVTGSSSSSGSGGTKNIRTTVPGSSAGVRPVDMDSAVDSIAQTLSTASISRSSSHGHPTAAAASASAAAAAGPSRVPTASKQTPLKDRDQRQRHDQHVGYPSHFKPLSQQQLHHLLQKPLVYCRPEPIVAATHGKGGPQSDRKGTHSMFPVAAEASETSGISKTSGVNKASGTNVAITHIPAGSHDSGNDHRISKPASSTQSRPTHRFGAPSSYTAPPSTDLKPKLAPSNNKPSLGIRENMPPSTAIPSSVKPKSATTIAPKANTLKSGGQFIAPPQLQLFTPKATEWKSKTTNPLASRNQAFVIKVPQNDPVLVTHAKIAMASAISNVQSPSKPTRRDHSSGTTTTYSDATVTDSIKRFLESINDRPEIAPMNAPAGFVGTLMPHQKLGLGWLVERELNGPCLGGILADEMGLGKTIQIIALILKNRPPQQFNGRHATLIVSPLAVIDQWQDEISDKTLPKSQRTLVFHGSDREKLISQFDQSDIVITTYDVLSSEFKKILEKEEAAQGNVAGKKRDMAITNRELSPLFLKPWFRVVLDEAHIIKTRSTLVARATHALQARSRFCLTGTPLQNSIEDLFSIFQFLKQDPYSDYDVFKQKILKPLKSTVVRDCEAGMAQVKLVLRALLLRRTKTTLVDGKPVVDLVPRKSEVHRLEFSPSERQLYDNLLSKIKKEAKAQQGNILTYILRLRQVCNHSSLIGTLADDDLKPEPVGDFSDLSKLLSNLNLGLNSGKKEETFEQNTLPSTKCDEVVKILLENKKNVNVSKTIVFSQFVLMLDILQEALHKANIHCCRYDGTMKRAEREHTLFQFKSNENISVMLISTKCGSTGINLTAANFVILVDPWWNPMIEEQAIGRVHRIGQTLPVQVIRLVIKDTIEEKVISKQKEKLDMIEGAIGIAGASKDQSLTKQEWMDLLFS